MLKKVYTRAAALEALKKGRQVIVMSDWLKEDIDFYMEGIKYSKDILKNAEYAIRNNPRLIRKGIKLWGAAEIWKYATEQVKRDNELAMMALTSDYDIVCDMLHDYNYSCFFNKRFIREILTKMADDYDFCNAMKNVSAKYRVQIANIQAAASILFNRLPKGMKTEELYNIAKRIVSPTLLIV